MDEFLLCIRQEGVTGKMHPCTACRFYPAQSLLVLLTAENTWQLQACHLRQFLVVYMYMNMPSCQIAEDAC